MTQLHLFDAPQSPVCFASPVSAEVVAEPSSREPSSPKHDRGAAVGAASATGSQAITPLPQLERGLPLYDPQRGEIHRFGDLAQRVISRYEIVAKRRAVLLARGPREAARA